MPDLPPQPVTVPDGVEACGCTSDVVQRLFAEAGLPQRRGQDLWASVEAHVQPHVGPLECVLHDAEPGPVWADVLLHRPTNDHPIIDLVSAGMSAKPMRLTRQLRKARAPRRAELLMRLPADWAPTPTVTESLATRRGLWLLEWLRILARVPQHLPVCLGDALGLPLSHRAIPPHALPSAPFPAAIVADPARFGRPLPTLMGRGRVVPLGHDAVRFLCVVPLHESEFEYAFAHGAQRLFDALAAAGVDDVVRCGRAAVV